MRHSPLLASKRYHTARYSADRATSPNPRTSTLGKYHIAISELALGRCSCASRSAQKDPGSSALLKSGPAAWSQETAPKDSGLLRIDHPRVNQSPVLTATMVVVAIARSAGRLDTRDSDHMTDGRASEHAGKACRRLCTGHRRRSRRRNSRCDATRGRRP